MAEGDGGGPIRQPPRLSSLSQRASASPTNHSSNQAPRPPSAPRHGESVLATEARLCLRGEVAEKAEKIPVAQEFSS